MVCDAVVGPGRKEEVLVMRRLGLGVWVVVAVELDGQLSRLRGCCRASWWDWDSAW